MTGEPRPSPKSRPSDRGDPLLPRRLGSKRAETCRGAARP
jgi:hypothetical protein